MKCAASFKKSFLASIADLWLQNLTLNLVDVKPTLMGGDTCCT